MLITLTPAQTADRDEHSGRELEQRTGPASCPCHLQQPQLRQLQSAADAHVAHDVGPAHIQHRNKVRKHVAGTATAAAATTTTTDSRDCYFEDAAVIVSTTISP